VKVSTILVSYGMRYDKKKQKLNFVKISVNFTVFAQFLGLYLVVTFGILKIFFVTSRNTMRLSRATTQEDRYVSKDQRNIEEVIVNSEERTTSC